MILTLQRFKLRKTVNADNYKTFIDFHPLYIKGIWKELSFFLQKH